MLAVLANILSVIATTLPLTGQIRARILSKALEFYHAEDVVRATRSYVRPACQEQDPAYDPESKNIELSSQDLFSAVSAILRNPAEHKYIALLGDTGTGKTTFLLNYHNYHMRNIRKRMRYRLRIIPLGVSDADSHIASIEDKSNTVLFLDALDEDVLAIVDHHQRLLDLCDLTKEFRSVLITCRTQFFPKVTEEPHATGVPVLRQRPLGESRERVFHKRYISPFSDKQTKKFLRLKYPLTKWNRRKKAERLIRRIPQLSARPLILTYIDDLLDIGGFSYTFRFFEEIVDTWLIRETSNVESMVNKDRLREFSEKLAIELFSHRKERGGEQLPHEEVSSLAKSFGIDIESWQLTSRSLLNRDVNDNLKFAHRSIMEYLFVKRFIFLSPDERPNKVRWTEQMHQFLWEIIQDGLDMQCGENFCLVNCDLMGLALSRGLKISDLRHKPDGDFQDREDRNKKSFWDNDTKRTSGAWPHLYIPHGPEEGRLILDLNSLLIWQQGGSGSQLNYRNAQLYINDLNLKKHGGYSDWRLPTWEEAMSLLEPKVVDKDLFIDSVFSQEVVSIWTSDYYYHTENAPFVDFARGKYSNLSREDTCYVRAVRHEHER